MAKAKKEVSVAEMIQEKIQSKMDTIITDATKFDSGNSAAGTRVRTGLQDVKAAIKEIRDAVTEIKANRK